MKNFMKSKIRSYQNIDKYIEKLVLKIKNDNLKKTILNTFKFSLEQTVQFNEAQQDTFIITGDIHAMWLRDSTNQIQPYLEFIKEDEQIQKVIKYLVFRQSKCILIDFYSNAFNKDHEGYSSQSDSSTEIINGVLEGRTHDNRIFERKWEVDSIGFHLKLVNQYISLTNDFSVINFESLQKIARELLKMQMGSFEDIKNNQDQYHIQQSSYTFTRPTNIPSETLQFSSGDPAIRTGMIRSNFRPSDDSQTFQFSIPGNALLQTELTKLVALLKLFKTSTQFPKQKELQVNELIETFDKMQQEILKGILQYGLIQDPADNEMYLAYEVDGYGSQLFMDDANLPSLLSLPYIGFVSIDDQLYQNTRKRLLDIKRNKFYFEGKEGAGIGGVHVGFDMIWPMSIIMQGLTSNDKEEIKKCLLMVINTTANTFKIHESFNKNNQYQFTRSDFGWANSLFAEFVMFIDKSYPDIFTSI